MTELSRISVKSSTRNDETNLTDPRVNYNSKPVIEGTSTPAVSARNVGLFVETRKKLVRVLADVTLEVLPGEFVGVLGPSGSGKTMFLNTIAGFENISQGELTVLGSPPKAGRPDVGYGMARDGLLPWRTAAENVELSLEARGVGKKERHDRALEALRLVDLENFAGTYRAELSQGMRQRVALARTLVTNPSLLLLDEPFAALDAQTRILMQERLLATLASYSGTVFLVTHDVSEAIVLCDRVLIFTKRPARVKAEFRIDFERPRSAVELRSSRQFQEFHQAIWQELAEEFKIISEARRASV